MQYALKPKGKPTSSMRQFIITLALITFSAVIFIGVQLDGSFRREQLIYSNETTQPHLGEVRTVQDFSFKLNIQFIGNVEAKGKKIQ